ncbi:hypothetical protein K0M31_001532 [Melipona bicolor]|uniref:Uncharacterized protein n=1 Tax=Melipona bicolor TaxID=60889 RepID=A0AA40GGI6_9HYME|nr:hypothetical protein K0M31_001532 [Melipona bicolor]
MFVRANPSCPPGARFLIPGDRSRIPLPESCWAWLTAAAAAAAATAAAARQSQLRLTAPQCQPNAAHVAISTGVPVNFSICSVG